ncbi:MAG: hypothetical protein CMF23_17850 [Ignavibacteriae bacterium]|nr:hypothetical protein [Ignavibacteriota bacterium]
MVYKANANVGFGDKVIYKNQTISEKDFKALPKRVQTKFSELKSSKTSEEVKTNENPNKGKEK